jgi:hypothetical protein
MTHFDSQSASRGLAAATGCAKMKGGQNILGQGLYSINDKEQ